MCASIVRAQFIIFGSMYGDLVHHIYYYNKQYYVGPISKHKLLHSQFVPTYFVPSIGE